jgi:alpha-1,2-mannosyltransferase
MTTRDRTLAVVLALAFAAALIVWQWNGTHRDLNAIYIAANFLAQGRPDLVYVATVDVFPDIASPEWQALQEGRACAPICAYPYVYPPVWAWLAAPLAAATTEQGFSNILLFLNMPMLAAIPLLAFRLWQPDMGAAKWTFRSVFLLFFTTIGTIGIANNQPQLAVTFLMLAAFEREAAGSRRLGGVLLGLAAALKIYPILLALFWLRGGNRVSVAFAAGVAAGFAVLSFAVAGVGLNMAFVQTAAGLSATLHPGSWNYSLPSVFGWLDIDALRAAKAAGEAWGPAVLAKALGLAVLLGGLALIHARWNAGDDLWRRRALLPALFALVCLFGPIGWTHYFIVPLLALQVLPLLYGARGQAMMIGLMLLAFWPLHVLAGLGLHEDADKLGTMGAVFALGTVLALALAPYRRVATSTSYRRRILSSEVSRA